uniref:Zinc finger-XS domain-containing protein n=1 Tax=Hordeum vulgare subsp. vulgare TaxID=112509 RepID=A0A8I6WRL6_HORVV
MEGARRAVAVADLEKEVPKQENTTATVVAAADLEKEVPKQEDTTASAVAAADLEKEVPKQEDTTSSGAAQAHDDEEKEAAGMKRKLAKTRFKSPYDSDYDDPYEYNSGDDVEDDNNESFIEKEAQKIREKGKAAYFKRGMFRCPYCTTKPKPKDGIYEHLMSHARGLSTSAAYIKTRVEHAALLKALGPI